MKTDPWVTVYFCYNQVGSLKTSRSFIVIESWRSLSILLHLEVFRITLCYRWPFLQLSDHCTNKQCSLLNETHKLRFCGQEDIIFGKRVLILKRVLKVSSKWNVLYLFCPAVWKCSHTSYVFFYFPLQVLIVCLNCKVIVYSRYKKI